MESCDGMSEQLVLTGTEVAAGRKMRGSRVDGPYRLRISFGLQEVYRHLQRVHCRGAGLGLGPPVCIDGVGDRCGVSGDYLGAARWTSVEVVGSGGSR